METETPTILLFVCNGTNPKSIMHDITQMLDTAFDSVDQEGMMPEEFEHKEILKFTLKLNAATAFTDQGSSQGLRSCQRTREEGIPL